MRPKNLLDTKFHIELNKRVYNSRESGRLDPYMFNTYPLTLHLSVWLEVCRFYDADRKPNAMSSGGLM